MKPKVVLEVSLTGAPPLLSIRGNVTGLAELAEALEQAASSKNGRVKYWGADGLIATIERVEG